MNTGLDPLIGRRLEGRYRVERHLADGGMGSVYVAHDERLARDVALKVLRADLARDPSFVARFQREAQAAARLTNPYVVAVHDQGRDGEYIYLAMELVRGRTLRALLRDPATTYAERLDIFDQILTGLAAAHADGLAHRDIKPENVLIDAAGHVKVADFGLARAIASTGRTSDSDVLLGTASYLSPEQVEHGRADTRSDVYACGLVLFELLEGHRAFDGPVPMNVAYRHVHDDVPALSPAVPDAPSFDALLERACAKDPEQRPYDAEILRTEFREVRSHLSPKDLARLAPVAAVGAASSAAPTDSHTAFLPHGATQVLARADRAPAEQHPSHRNWILPAIGSFVAVCLVWLFFFGPLGLRSVPAVRGQAQGQAVSELRSAGFDVEIRHANDDSLPAGRAIGTSPHGGSHRWPIESVTLTMSDGPRMVRIPDVAGKDEQSARSALAKADLRVSKTSQVFSRTPAGQAAGTDPAVGSTVRHGTGLTLNISKGPAPFTVPDVTHQDKDAATNQLQQGGLTVTVAQASSDDVPNGQVISTDPQAGTTLHAGDSITITVSTGKEMVAVPDVTGMSASDAEQTLQSAGFSVDGASWFDDLLDRTVTSQSPSGGGDAKAPKGSKITLSF